MKIFKYPLKFFDSLLDRILAAVSAILFSQIPAFISHYTQRLGGHVAEAERNVASWQAIANKTANGSLDKLVEAYRQNADLSVLEAGNKCLADLTRLKDLQSSLDALLHAGPLNRFPVFLKNMDSDVIRGTCKSFTPNLPLNPESLVYALIGLVFGVIFYQGLKMAFRTLGKRLTRKNPESSEIERPEENP